MIRKFSARCEQRNSEYAMLKVNLTTSPGMLVVVIRGAKRTVGREGEYEFITVR
jgi:hypothetical protein